MIAIDTNVLIRFLVDDDQTQNDAARAFMAARTEDDPAYVCAVTLAETAWVLTRALGYGNKDITLVIRRLLASEGLIMEHATELGLLVGEGLPSKADIADFLVAWSGAKAGARMTITFDRQAARTVPGMELLA